MTLIQAQEFKFDGRLIEDKMKKWLNREFSIAIVNHKRQFLACGKKVDGRGKQQRSFPSRLRDSALARTSFDCSYSMHTSNLIVYKIEMTLIIKK